MQNVVRKDEQWAQFGHCSIMDGGGPRVDIPTPLTRHWAHLLASLHLGPAQWFFCLLASCPSSQSVTQFFGTADCPSRSEVWLGWTGRFRSLMPSRVEGRYGRV